MGITRSSRFLLACLESSVAVLFGREDNLIVSSQEDSAVCHVDDPEFLDHPHLSSRASEESHDSVANLCLGGVFAVIAAVCERDVCLKSHDYLQGGYWLVPYVYIIPRF